MERPAEESPAPPKPSFGQALAFWFKLGWISFGGPAGQIAVMHVELVERRRWVSEQRFLHALNYCMALPGPEAQQLATYLGWLLHGTRGGVAAGALFILPSLAILGGLTWIYLALGHVPAIQGLLYGMKPAVVAVVVAAVLRIGRRAIVSPLALALAVGAFLAMVWHAPYPLIVLAAATLGWLGSWSGLLAAPKHGPAKAHGSTGGVRLRAVIDDDDPTPDHARVSGWRLARTLVLTIVLWGGPLLALAAMEGWQGLYPQMGLFFTQAALLTFGGAYAVLPYVGRHALEQGWLASGQMADGLALGETTPGPLIMFVTFVGFVAGWREASALGTSTVAAGWLGAVVAAWFTFLPSFAFIFAGAPFIERWRGVERLSAALSGVTAAVVGLILHLGCTLAIDVFSQPASPLGVELPAIVIAAAAFAALGWKKYDLVYVVLACGGVGLALRLLGIVG